MQLSARLGAEVTGLLVTLQPLISCRRWEASDRYPGAHATPPTSPGAIGDAAPPTAGTRQGRVGGLPRSSAVGSADQLDKIPPGHRPILPRGPAQSREAAAVGEHHEPASMSRQNRRPKPKGRPLPEGPPTAREPRDRASPPRGSRPQDSGARVPTPRVTGSPIRAHGTSRRVRAKPRGESSLARAAPGRSFGPRTCGGGMGPDASIARPADFAAPFNPRVGLPRPSGGR